MKNKNAKIAEGSARGTGVHEDADDDDEDGVMMMMITTTKP